MQKRAVQFTYLPLFLSETANTFAMDYAIKKSFRHALHLVTAYLHRQNQVAHALRTRDFWLASLSIDFPIHFALRAHEYPATLMKDQGEVTPIDPIVTAVGQCSMVKAASVNSQSADIVWALAFSNNCWS